MNLDTFGAFIAVAFNGFLDILSDIEVTAGGITTNLLQILIGSIIITLCFAVVAAFRGVGSVGSSIRSVIND